MLGEVAGGGSNAFSDDKITFYRPIVCHSEPKRFELVEELQRQQLNISLQAPANVKLCLKCAYALSTPFRRVRNSCVVAYGWS